MKISICLSVFLVLIHACQKSDCPNDWQKYDGDYFSICHPNTWDANDSGIYGSELVLLDLDDAESQGFGRNINIVRQHDSIFPELSSLQDYAEFSKNQILAYLGDAKVLLFKPKNFSNINTYKMVMTAIQQGRDLFFEQYYFKHNNDYYVVTFTSAQNEDPGLRQKGSEIIESIKMK